MQILAVSDQVNELIYSPQVQVRFRDIDVVISCGDLPYYYIEYIACHLNQPTFYVRGNHASQGEVHEHGVKTGPEGATDLHHRVIHHPGLLLAGVEGSLRYRPGPFMYSQREMWWYVYSLLPGLLLNRLRFGRYLDVFVSHAPPWGIYGDADLPHQGIKAFLWLDRVFQPAYHLHGHIHLLNYAKRQSLKVGRTKVVNAFNYQVINLPAPASNDLPAQ
jgi:Icc-related predicted phosphoesterase